MLSSDVLKHFELTANPFTPTLDSEADMYQSSWHKYALEIMRETAISGGFSVITGQVGSGKTTVMEQFIAANECNHKYHIILTMGDKRNMQPVDLQTAIVSELTADSPKRNRESLARQVHKLLLANERTVILIDEAHLLPVTTIKFLKQLWDSKNGFKRLIGIILIGQSELEETLYGKRSAVLREVAARAVHAKLSALGTQVADYVTHRIKCTKGKPERVIDKSALAALPNALSDKDRNGKILSLATPLQTNRVMMELMLYAYGHGEEVITLNTLKQLEYIKVI